jgi:tripartite-type tricarboxylate transporter receptor subunit TctC
MEQGVPNYDVRGWFALCAPTGTPKPVLDKMNFEVNRILKDENISARLKDAGMRPMGGSLPEATALVNKEIES